jgi:hypothetical protein
MPDCADSLRAAGFGDVKAHETVIPETLGGGMPDKSAKIVKEVLF